MSNAPPDAGGPRRPAVLTAGWWLRDRRSRRGRWTLGQPPNPALWVFAVLTVLRWLPLGSRDGELQLLATGALLVWGLDELVRGVNPARRLLGAVVLTWQVVGWLTQG